MRRFISKLANTLNPAGKTRAAWRSERRASLQVESLESRLVPSTLLDPIQAKYQSLGGAAGWLGAPTSLEMPTPYGGGPYETFQNGNIYWSASTLAHFVHGGILGEYGATAGETDANGTNLQQVLGLPTSDETGIPGVSGLCAMNTFVGGAIYWSPGTGPHAVYGPIADKYNNSLGGAARFGLPTSDEAAAPGLPGVRVGYFAGGHAIYWSSAYGAHNVDGGILGEYALTAGETDANGTAVQKDLGAPTGDESPVTGASGAWMNTFAGGAIYWSPGTGAHAVYGPAADKYKSLPASYYFGLPLQDQQPLPGGGWSQDFQGGTIIGRPARGPVEVHGDIRSKWLSLGGAAGSLGYPTSDVEKAPDGKGYISYFDHGFIYWSSDTGTLVNSVPVHTAPVVLGLQVVNGIATYQATYPPIGASPTAVLTGVSNVAGSGFSITFYTLDGKTPVVALAPGQIMTADNLTKLYGSSKPHLPVSFLATVVTAPGYIPPSVTIYVSYQDFLP
jgi:uncharacterized protein with LGFP repeats